MATKKKKKGRGKSLRSATYVIYALLIALCAALIGISLSSSSADQPAASAPTPVLTQAPSTAARSEPDFAPSATPEAEPTAEPTPEPTAEPTPEPSPAPALSKTASLSLPNRDDAILITAIGDCTLGGVYKSSTAASFKSLADKYGYGYFMQNVVDIFSMDDLTIANLEVVLVSSGEPRSGREFIMHGYPEYVNILTEGSIEAVTVANNHAKDFNRTGLNKTKKAVQEAGVSVCGYDSIAIYETKGKKIALLGYTVWDNDYSQMQKEIKEYKNKADLVIVSIHGGEEKRYTPTSDQKKYCRAAVDAGADLVIGHHPHVINGIETYKGVTIVYSLGNFCFGGNRNPDDKDTFIFQQEFVIADDGTLSPGAINVIPCSISSSTSINDFKPTPLEGKNADKVMEKIINSSKGMENAFTGLPSAAEGAN